MLLGTRLQFQCHYPWTLLMLSRLNFKFRSAFSFSFFLFFRYHQSEWTFSPGNLHEVLVELEGMGGGGRLQLEVYFSGAIVAMHICIYWRIYPYFQENASMPF